MSLPQADLERSWALRLPSGQAQVVAATLAEDLWPLPDGIELDKHRERLLEEVRWTPGTAKDGVRGELTLEEFWAYLVSLLNGVASARRRAKGTTRQPSEDDIGVGDLTAALRVLLSAELADPVVGAVRAAQAAGDIVGPDRGRRISRSRWQALAQTAHPRMRAAHEQLISVLLHDGRFTI